MDSSLQVKKIFEAEALRKVIDSLGTAETMVADNNYGYITAYAP